MSTPDFRVVEAWLRFLVTYHGNTGWALERAFLTVVGHDRARGLTHRVLARLVEGAWIVPSGLLQPSGAQEDLLGPEALRALTDEAQEGRRPDLSVFSFTPGPNAALARWAAAPEKEALPS